MKIIEIFLISLLSLNLYATTNLHEKFIGDYTLVENESSASCKDRLKIATLIENYQNEDGTILAKEFFRVESTNNDKPYIESFLYTEVANLYSGEEFTRNTASEKVTLNVTWKDDNTFTIKANGFVRFPVEDSPVPIWKIDNKVKFEFNGNNKIFMRAKVWGVLNRRCEYEKVIEDL